MRAVRDQPTVAHGPYLYLLVATLGAAAVMLGVAWAVHRYPRRERLLIATGVVVMPVVLIAPAVLFFTPA